MPIHPDIEHSRTCSKGARVSTDVIRAFCSGAETKDYRVGISAPLSYFSGKHVTKPAPT